MLSRDIIEKILTAGAQAPSGSNSQPWRFEVEGDVIRVFMMPEKDHPILNFRKRGTLMAVGCLIENISIAANHYGFAADIDLFPDEESKNLVARIKLIEKKTIETAGLFEAIIKRTTNRKPFQRKKIPDDIKKRFSEIPKEIGRDDIILKLTEDEKDIERFSRAASTNEIVMFENKDLHKLFFEEIVWTEAEEHEKKSGLYLKTMELKPPQAAVLKLFRAWPFMNFLNKFGATRGIAIGNAKGYAACGMYGAIICKNKDEAFVDAGRAIERIWLFAAASGLSFHLQTGLNFLWMRMVADGIPGLSEKHADLIKKNYNDIAETLGVSVGVVIPALFRIGYDGEPSARSSKKAPVISYL